MVLCACAQWHLVPLRFAKWTSRLAYARVKISKEGVLKEYRSAVLQRLLQCLLGAHCSGVVHRLCGVSFVFEESWWRTVGLLQMKI